MPIFYQQDIDDDTRLAVWHIRESEDFFLADVPLQQTITHPHKRLQHLAGRYLLKFLFPDFPLSLIQIADTRKPFLEDEAYHFSISHCDAYAAVIVSKQNRVGVDVELASPKVQRLQSKFISTEEKMLAAAALMKEEAYATFIWSCKEAVFKWYGKGQVDFKNHMQVRSIIAKDDQSFESIMAFKKHELFYLDLQTRFFGKLCLSWVCS